MVDRLLTATSRQAVDNTADNGFSKEAWSVISSEFNDGREMKLTKTQLHSKLCSLKKKYMVFKAMKTNSGWGWDEVRQVPDCDIDVWKDYVERHPDAAEFRKNNEFVSFMWYEQLDAIFTGSELRIRSYNL